MEISSKNGQKWPKMAKNGQKWPKIAKSSSHHTMPCAPDPIGFRFWYRLSMVNLVSPTSTV